MGNRARSAVVTLRVPDELDRRIEREARRQRRTKSALLREAIAAAFAGPAAADDPAVEARRQSLLVSGRKSEREALDFVVSASDTRGWR